MGAQVTGKLLAFAADLELVDAIEMLVLAATEKALTPRGLAVSIVETISAPQDGFTLRERLGDALLHAEWSESTNRSQSLSTVLRYTAQEGYLTDRGQNITCKLVDAALTELRLPSVEMVDAGQRELNNGAKNFLRIWLKAWERA